MPFRETSISKHFIKISDPRIANKTQHSLLNILTIVLCAVISGSEDFYDIEEYAESKQDFFETFLDLPHGSPSHDTINRVISVKYLFNWEMKQGFNGVFLTESHSTETRWVERRLPARAPWSYSYAVIFIRLP